MNIRAMKYKLTSILLGASLIMPCGAAMADDGGMDESVCVLYAQDDSGDSFVNDPGGTSNEGTLGGGTEGETTSGEDQELPGDVNDYYNRFPNGINDGGGDTSDPTASSGGSASSGNRSNDQPRVVSTTGSKPASVSANSGTKTQAKASTAGSSNKSSYTKPTVTKSTGRLTLSVCGTVILSPGGKLTVRAVSLPSGDSIASWSSSNKKSVIVTRGRITAKKAGKAIITVKTKNGVSASFVVSVKKPAVKINKRSVLLAVHQQYRGLMISGLSSGDTVSRWKSSNPRIVSVSRSGVLKAKKAGSAKITVTTKLGAKTTVKVRVRKKA